VNLEHNIAKIITDSSLWNLGKDSHNALSELTKSILELVSQDRKELEAEVARLRSVHQTILDKFVGFRYDYEFKDYMITEGIKLIEQSLKGDKE
jgi:hypothetical protein